MKAQVLKIPTPIQTNEEFSIILETLKLYNPRISEILQLRKRDIIANQYVVLKGKKRSSDIIIRDRVLVAEIIKLAGHRKDQLFIYSKYHQVYSYILRTFYNLVKSVSRGKNKKVTHAFRYRNAQLTNSESAVTSILHHRSIKSNHFYNPNIKGDHHG